MSKSTQANGKGPVTIGQMIEDATVEDCENSMIIQICDIINSLVDGPRDAVKSIRKCFATKSPSVIVQTLVLLEACVKNCGMRFCVQIASRDFLDDFLKILKAKYNHSRELQMTVLGLLQVELTSILLQYLQFNQLHTHFLLSLALRFWCHRLRNLCNVAYEQKLMVEEIIELWAFAFENIPELKEVSRTYQDLKNKNVEFPPLDPNKLMELDIPVKIRSTDSAGATDLLLPEGGQMNSHTLLSPGAGPQMPRRSSTGVIRSGTDSQQVRRPSAVTVQSYLLATGTVFQNSRRPSAESIHSIRRSSAEMIHHSCLSPTGTDNENARRRPSADMFHQPSLSPGGTDNEKSRRRNSRDIVHNSCLSPSGTDNEKSRRRPSTGMVQLSCLSPTGTDCDKTRRRLSIESQSRRASIESMYRRASLECELRRASLESQMRRHSTENQSAARSSEGRPVGSSPSAPNGVVEPVASAGIKCHPDQATPVSTTTKGGPVVDNLIDLGGSPTKQPIAISLDVSSMKANDVCNPCIVVTTIEEEVVFDQEEDNAETDQWVMQN